MSKKPLVRCPQGHPLPTRGSEGECTPLRCGAPELHARTDERTDLDKTMTMAKYKAKEDGSMISEKSLKAAVRVAKDGRKVRNELAPVPEGLEGAEAEAWTVRKLGDLAPYAAAQLEYDLLYGSDRARSDAAKEVLDRTGHGRKGDSGVGGPVIVLNMGSLGQLPWAPRNQTVDAKVSSDKGGKGSTE